MSAFVSVLITLKEMPSSNYFISTLSIFPIFGFIVLYILKLSLITFLINLKTFLFLFHVDVLHLLFCLYYDSFFY